MRYIPLFSLKILHDYYTNSRCFDFDIESTFGTQKLLRNCRGVLKTTPDGISFLVPVDQQNNLFIPLPERPLFVFRLKLRNPDFALYTNMSAFAALAAPLYTNSTFPDGGELTLQATSKVDKGVFANVEINFNHPVHSTDNAAFQIVFEARKTRWKYYVITDRAITSATLEDADQSMFFDMQDLVTLPDESDMLARMLTERYPEKKCFRFVSNDLVSCQQTARKGIQLQLNGTKVIGSLPNPSLENYSIDARNQTTEYTLYQVVKYFNP